MKNYNYQTVENPPAITQETLDLIPGLGKNPLEKGMVAVFLSGGSRAEEPGGLQSNVVTKLD